MRRMTVPGEWRCPAAAVGPGRTLTFRLRCRGRVVDGFVVNHRGSLRAYVNRCPHAGTTLDLWPNDFYAADFSADGVADVIGITPGGHMQYYPNGSLVNAGGRPFIGGISSGDGWDVYTTRLV